MRQIIFIKGGRQWCLTARCGMDVTMVKVASASQEGTYRAGGVPVRVEPYVSPEAMKAYLLGRGSESDTVILPI